MQIHQLHIIHKRKKAKRIGRGGKRGTFSGRGVKGQRSRSGARIRPEWRDLIKKIPKKRGASFKSIRKKPAIVNLDELERVFKAEELVSPKTLIERGLVGRIRRAAPAVKVLGRGELTKSLIIKGVEVSKSAKEKIEKAGGVIK